MIAQMDTNDALNKQTTLIKELTVPLVLKGVQNLDLNLKLLSETSLKHKVMKIYF